MRIIVVGFGRVGSRTAQILAAEGHDVIVVDNDSEKVHKARNRGFTVIKGDGGSQSVLEEAGIASTDAVGGFTGSIETNHTICRIGAAHGCRTVMRLSEDLDPEVYDRYKADADAVIYPERFGAAGAKTALLEGDFNVLDELTEDLQLFVLTIPETAPTVDERVNGIDLEDKGRIYAHGHEGEALTIPLPGTRIEAHDRIALLASTDSIDEVRSRITGK